MRRRLVILALLATALAAQAGRFHLYLENDLWASRDENYTHGTRAEYWYEDTGGFVIGQYIYTPSDISVSELIPNDRPYAGWLYAGVLRSQASERSYNTFEMTLGIVGPSSGAEATQKSLHKMLGEIEPQGWDNQLHDELAIQAQYRQAWRNIAGSPAGWAAELRPNLVGALGNVMTYIGGGATIYCGFRPPDPPHYPVVGIKQATSNWRGGFLAGGEGRLVIHNMFLDGNLDGDSHSVDKKNLVADGFAGVYLGYRDVTLTAAHNVRSREFDLQARHHEFTSVSLRYDF